MTHEFRGGDEPEGGPQNDPSLPDAENAEVHYYAEDSDAAPLDDEEPGAYPTWAGTERNEV